MRRKKEIETVADLIRVLSKAPRDAKVLIDGDTCDKITYFFPTNTVEITKFTPF